MVKHIVMWKFKAENLEANRAKAKEMLETLPAFVKSIQFFEVGVDFDKSDRAFDLVLVSSFNDKAGLEEYKVHPKHVEVAVFIKEVVEIGKVVDYEV